MIKEDIERLKKTVEERLNDPRTYFAVGAFIGSLLTFRYMDKAVLKGMNKYFKGVTWFIKVK